MSKQQPNKTPEDEDAWAEAIKDVKKIKPQAEPPVAPIKLPEIKKTINLAQAYRGEDLHPLIMGNTDNIDANTAKKFKRCEFPIEGNLDLHGYHEEDAKDAVFNFVQSSYISGKRCIIIITGKGLSREDNPDNFLTPKGKLREYVPLWLNGNELRPLILAYNHPPAKLGGTGAFYILLRRHR